ncbi:LOW QUALITY PROTEIN: hypothetical protein V1478_017938 [Vespula squamosa]|uniref:Uncharacterized protein n=1 Tax=Vespula squamosa TaxID=30214 RepID=A0ABD1ZY70_VESSQ
MYKVCTISFTMSINIVLNVVISLIRFTVQMWKIVFNNNLLVRNTRGRCKSTDRIHIQFHTYNILNINCDSTLYVIDYFKRFKRLTNLTILMALENTLFFSLFFLSYYINYDAITVSGSTVQHC